MEAQGKQLMQMIVTGLNTVISPKRENKNLVSVSGISKESNESTRPLLTVKINMARGKRLFKNVRTNLTCRSGIEDVVL